MTAGSISSVLRTSFQLPRFLVASASNLTRPGGRRLENLRFPSGSTHLSTLTKLRCYSAAITAATGIMMLVGTQLPLLFKLGPRFRP